MKSTPKYTLLQAIEHLQSQRKDSTTSWDAGFTYIQQPLTQSQVISCLAFGWPLFNGDLHNYVSDYHHHQPLALTRLLSEQGMVNALYQYNVLLRANMIQGRDGVVMTSGNTPFDEYDLRVKDICTRSRFKHIQAPNAVTEGVFIVDIYKPDNGILDIEGVLTELLDYFSLSITISWAVPVENYKTIVITPHSNKSFGMKVFDYDEFESVREALYSGHSIKKCSPTVDLDFVFQEALKVAGTDVLFKRFVHLTQEAFSNNFDSSVHQQD